MNNFKDTKQHKTQLNLISSNLDFLRTLIPTDLPKLLTGLDERIDLVDSNLIRKVVSINDTLVLLNTEVHNFIGKNDQNYAKITALEDVTTQTSDELDQFKLQLNSVELQATIKSIEQKVEKLKNEFETKQDEIMSSVELKDTANTIHSIYYRVCSTD